MIHDDDIAEGVVVTIDPYPRWAMANVRQPLPPYMGTIEDVRRAPDGKPYAMQIRDERTGEVCWWLWAQGWQRFNPNGGTYHRDELHLGPPLTDMLWDDPAPPRKCARCDGAIPSWVPKTDEVCGVCTSGPLPWDKARED